MSAAGSSTDGVRLDSSGKEPLKEKGDDGGNDSSRSIARIAEHAHQDEEASAWLQKNQSSRISAQRLDPRTRWKLTHSGATKHEQFPSPHSIDRIPCDERRHEEPNLKKPSHQESEIR